MDPSGERPDEMSDRADGAERGDGAAPVDDAGSPTSSEPAKSPDPIEEPARPTISASAVRAATTAPDAESRVPADEGDAEAAVGAEARGGAEARVDAEVSDSDAPSAEEAPSATDVAAEGPGARDDEAPADDEEPQPAETPGGGSSAGGEDSDGDGGEDGSDVEDDENLEAWRSVPLTTRLEALLFAATAPVSLRRLQTLAGDVEAGDVRDAIASLQAHYDASERAFGIQEIGGGYQLRTSADLSELLARLGRKTDTDKLSPAAIETLAIVAYRQPVLRVDVEKIRGVASGEVLRTLVEKGVVRVAGRADLPGSPLLYGTTAAFLEIFGLRDLRDLPNDRELLRA